MMKKKHTIRILTLMMMVCAMLGAYPHTAEAASKDTQARNAYAKYMSAKNIWWVNQYFPSSKFVFAIMDINNDDVPELYIENHDAYGYQGNGDVYTYRNGKMQKMYHFDNCQSMRAYYPGRGVFLDDGGRMGYYPCYYVKMNASGQATAQIASILQEEFKDGKRKEVTRYYKISGMNKEIEISKSEFNKRKQSLVGRTAPKKPVLRKNTAANRKKYLLPKTSGSSVKLNKTSVTLYLDTNKTYQLKATIKGASKNAKWTSSNKKIVTVTSKGKITAKKAGTAYITVQANGKTAKCKVTVKNKKNHK